MNERTGWSYLNMAGVIPNLGVGGVMIGGIGRWLTWARRVWLTIVALGVALAACSADQRGEEPLGVASQGLTSLQERVLGFESVGTDWSASSGTLSQSSQHVEGAGSLAIANSGNTTITSAALSSLGPVSDTITLDALLPTTQPNPWWMGTLRIVVECPSQQLYYEALAEHQLQGRATGQFLRFEFPLSASTREKLSTGNYSDLRFKILLNVATGAGPWLFDRLWVSAPAGGAGGSGGTGAGGTTAGGTSAASGEAGSSNSPTNNGDILGFETPSRWSTTAATLARSDTRVEGAHALQVSAVSYAEITSDALTTLGSVGSVIGFDLSVPNPTGDVWWWGSAAVSLDCPSRGIHGRWLGQQELNGARLGTFRRVEVPLPDDVRAALQGGSYSDLRVKVILNVPAGSGPYLLDRFTFTSQVPQPAPPAPSAAVDAVLGMESLEGWKTSAGTLALSGNALVSQSSIAVGDFGYADVTSIRLSSLGHPLKDELTVDLRFPAPPSPSWTGSIAASLSIPSKGVYGQWLGIKELTGLLSNAWHRVRFPIDATLRSKLEGEYGDLEVKFSLNRPTQPGVWLLDNVQFGQISAEPPTPLEEREFVIPLPRGASFDTVAVGVAVPRRGVEIGQVGGAAAVNLYSAFGFADIAGVRNPASAFAGGHVRNVFASRDVVLSPLTHIHGFLAYGRQLERPDTAVIDGAVLAGDDAKIRESDVGRLKFAFPPTLGATDVTLGASDTRDLAPGAYDAVSVQGGTLRLGPGSYFMSTLTVSGGSLEIDNSDLVFVHVTSELQFHSNYVLTNPNKSNVLFTIRGGQASTIFSPMSATFVAVDNFALITQAAVTGSIFGRRIEASGDVHLAPYRRDDCASQPCGTFGCSAVDSDGDGLFDCQEEQDGDSWTDKTIFNGVRAALYESDRDASSCGQVDSLAEVEAVVASRQPKQSQELYFGWDLPQVPGVAVGCPDSYYWPSWPHCTTIGAVGQTATGFGFDYKGFIKLRAGGQHCFKITSGPATCANLFLNDAQLGSPSDTEVQCADLPGGIYPVRWFVDRSQTAPAGSAIPERDFKLSYCFGGDAECEPIATLPQSMLRLDLDTQAPCSSQEQCLATQYCSQTGQCRDDDEPCVAQEDCAQGDICEQGSCTSSICLTPARNLACGFPGAPCECDGVCSSDADCADGKVCVEDAGTLLGLAADTDVCLPPVCVPDCADKVCGDVDLSDGCTGFCTAVCDTGEVGCNKDSDCTSGNVCRRAECVPLDPCGLPNLAPPNCGPDSICGACPPSVIPSCDDRACGIDPETGANCGGCPATHFCNGAGQCARLEQTPPITVPSVDDDTREVVPPASPPAPELFGGTPGTFSVSDRGSAMYAIPIEVPPGRAGIEPTLSLRYASSTGNGALGVGWSLDGFSSIARCQRTYAQDGYTQGVKGNETDALCLDGQRLTPHGANEYRTQMETFAKIVVDGRTATGPISFKVYAKDGRILTYGGTAQSRSALRGGIVGSWHVSRVEDRSGNFMRVAYRQSTSPSSVAGKESTSELVPAAVTYTGHGSTDGDSEVLFEYDTTRPDILDGFRPGGGAFARIRRLTHVDVRAQNALVRRYSLTYETAPNGVSRIATIQECAGAAGAFCKHPTEVEYFDESGWEESYVKIIPQDANSQLAPPFPPYGIVHKSSQGRDVITALTLDSTPYYVTPMPQYLDVAISFIPVAGEYAAKLYQALQVYGMQTRHFNWYEAYTFDLISSTKLFGTGGCNGGRWAPVMHVVGNGYYGEETIYHQCPSVRTLEEDQAPFEHVIYKRPEWLVDLDGDGVQDVLYCAEETIDFPPYPFHYTRFREMHLDYKLAKAAEQLDPKSPADPKHEDRDGEIPWIGDVCKPPKTATDSRQFSMLFDVDGDGTANLVVYDELFRWMVLLRNADGEFEWRLEPMFGLSMKPSAHTITILDVNGDGLRDLLAEPHHKVNIKEFGDGPEAAVASRTPLVAINTGRGFNEVLLNAQDPVNGGRASSLPAYAVDLDRDGVDELVVTGETGLAEPWRRRRMVGDTLVEEQLDLEAGPGVLGDFDGDGNVDAFTKVKGQPHRVYPGRGRRQNLLKAVTDGTGHKTEVRYDETNLQDEPTFSKFPANGDCRWPQRCQARVEHALVSSHVESHFEDQARTQEVPDRQHSYSYAGARSDVGGYGWLGFSERDVVAFDGAGEFLHSSHTEFEDPSNWEPGTTTAPYYYTKVGLPKRTEEVLPHADSPLSVSSTDHIRIRKDFEWTEATSASGRPFVYLSKTTATTTNVVNSTLAKFLFQRVATTAQDEHGNVKDEFVTSFDLDAAGEALAGSETTHRITTTFEPTEAEVTEWLISRPKRQVVQDTPRCTGAIDCVQKLREQVHTFDYYPDTDLVRYVVRQPDDPLLQQTTELERDDKGNVTSAIVTNFEGDTRQVTTEFDQRGLYPITVTRVGDATEQQTQVRHDARFGTLVTRADPNGIDETWSYDAFGVQRTHRGPTAETSVDYAEADLGETEDGFPLRAAYQVVSSKAGGARVEEEFSSFGQLVRRKSFGFNGDEVHEEFAYDERQLLRERRRPHLEGDLTQDSIHYEYDELDRLIGEEYPDGAVVEHQHISVAAVSTSVAGDWLVPGAMNITRTIDPRLNATVQVVDRDGQTVHMVDALNQGTRYTYGAFGQLTQIQDAGARSISLVHDAFGRTLRTSDAAHGGTQVSEYNGLDELVTTTDAGGRARDYLYDAYGRLIQTDDDDGTTSFAYDGSGENEIGRLVQTTGPTGQLRTVGYEPREATRNRGLPLKSTDTLHAPDAEPGDPARELTTTLGYDEFARLARIEYPSGAGSTVAVEYTFDAYGHTMQARNASDPTQIYWQLITADQGYRIEQERFGTHACGSSAGTLTTRDYDQLTGSLKSIQTTCGAQTLQNLSYDYDKAGNLTERTDDIADTFEEFGYDELNRPITRRTMQSGEFSSAYAYDPALGRLTSQASVGEYTYAPNGRDWIATAGSHTYGRDSVGNVTSRSGPTVPGGSQAIEYTTQNLPSAITSGNEQTRFSYDSGGQRVVKQNSSVTTFYQGDLYQRTEAATSTDHRYMIYAGARAIAELSAQDGGSPSVRYMHADVLGSIQTTTTSSGVMAATSNYGPFGAALSPPTAGATPYGFTGHESDDDVGLINMKGRMYDPALGQFMSPDPIVAQPFSQGLNRFAYVNNSPLNFTDPTGYSACPNRGGRGCSASTTPGYTALGIGAGAIVVGAAAYGAAQLWAGPQAISASATLGAGAPPSGGGAEDLASLGPEDGGAVPGLSNVVSAGDAVRFNAQIDARQKTTRTGLKPTGNASVGTNGGAPGRGAVAPDAAAPVREATPPAVLNDRSRFAGAEYAITRALHERKYDLAIGIARRFWGANPAVPASYDKYLVDREGRPAYGETRYYAQSGAVTISVGPKGVTDARVLLSTMYHEEGATGSHVAQAGPPRNFASDTRPVAVAVNELQAYRAERAISSQLGLNQVEVGAIERNIQENLQIIQGTPYAPRVAAGDYSLFDSDRATP